MKQALVIAGFNAWDLEGLHNKPKEFKVGDVVENARKEQNAVAFEFQKTTYVFTNQMNALAEDTYVNRVKLEQANLFDKEARKALDKRNKVIKSIKTLKF